MATRRPIGRRCRITLLALVGLGAAQPTAAQVSDGAQAPAGPGEEGRGFFQVGYLGLDLDDLNDRLEGAGLPGLDGTVLTLGGAGYGTRGRMMFGLEGHGLLGGDGTTADGTTQVSLGGGYGLFRVGYRAYSRGRLDIYPVFGIGGGQMSVKIRERSAPVFDDVLAGPQRSSSLTTGMFLLDFAVGLDYRFVVESDEEDFGGVALGLHVGYTLAPGDTSWKLDDINNVAGGPSAQIEGFYVRASIGFWGGGSPQVEGS
jgi:hypothetical protein